MLFLPTLFLLLFFLPKPRHLAPSYSPKSTTAFVAAAALAAARFSAFFFARSASRRRASRPETYASFIREALSLRVPHSRATASLSPCRNFIGEPHFTYMITTPCFPAVAFVPTPEMANDNLPFTTRGIKFVTPAVVTTNTPGTTWLALPGAFVAIAEP
jgi:hypothetical protein